MRDDKRQGKTDPLAPRTRRARWLVVLGVGGLSLLAAACGDGSGSAGVAIVGSTTAPATTTASSSPGGNSGTSSAGSLAYAKCMRSHGLSDFPDPNTQGGFDDLPTNISFNSSQYVAANKACQPLTGGGLHLSQADQEQLEAHALKFAQCMRSHGVPNYPDPTFNFSGGGVSEKSGGRGGGLNAASPQVQTAQKACQQSRTTGGS